MLGKKILIGITGSIAAYKSALLVRELIKKGAEVRVVMTDSAQQFITPLTLSTLSQHHVYTGFAKDNDNAWNNHVDLALWADCFVIAPASAHTIGKMANGICDNFLLACYFSARCPVVICPAMDLDMYIHPSIVGNMQRLVSYGNHIIDAQHGELASGLVGKGRMAEPEDIASELDLMLTQQSILSGKNVLITSGPTQEALDPVRYITNHSTGKMGKALAEEAQLLGAEVTFITGPSSFLPKIKNGKTINITSAQQLYDAVLKEIEMADIIIFAAAVADYTPKEISNSKIKKKEDTFNIELVKTKDIAFEIGQIKKPNQFTVGFALETNDLISNAQAKLQKKNLDLIVLNSPNDPQSGFGFDTNKIKLIDKKSHIIEFDLKQKTKVAQDIWAEILKALNNKAQY